MLLMHKINYFSTIAQIIATKNFTDYFNTVLYTTCSVCFAVSSINDRKIWVLIQQVFVRAYKGSVVGFEPASCELY